MIGAAIHLMYEENPNYYLTNLRIAFTALGVTDFIIIDGTQYKMASYFLTSEMNVHVFDTLEECEEHFPDIDFVYLEPKYIAEEVSVSLHDFVHPDNAIYVVGPNTATIPFEGREDGNWVNIPMQLETDGFYAETAILFPLYDRSVKEWA